MNMCTVHVMLCTCTKCHLLARSLQEDDDSEGYKLFNDGPLVDGGFVDSDDDGDGDHLFILFR